MLEKDRRLTVRMIADEVGISKESAHRILIEVLGMRKICAKMVPRNLCGEQKENRLLICQELLDRLKRQPNFMDRAVTGDESWIFEYDPETKQQSAEWHTTSSP